MSEADMTLQALGKLTEDEARAYLERLRWPDDRAECPHCGVVGESSRMERKPGAKMRDGLWNCRACRKQFSVTVGGIMEGSHLPLAKWLMAFYLMGSSKKGISALQLQRQLGIGSYRSAWHLCHRIRAAMDNNPDAPLMGGEVEMDEAYVGGKPRRVPGTRGGGNRWGRGRGVQTKTPVAVLVSRDGEARCRSVANVTAATLKGNVRANVERTAKLYSDEWAAYRGLDREFASHDVTHHAAGEYARPGGIHSNTAESYFALLKRGVYGQFHHVSKQHLDRYLAEFSFRWTHKRATDTERTREALSRAQGVRLYYRQPKRVVGRSDGLVARRPEAGGE